MRTLLIDDMRDIKADVVARTFQEGIDALINKGPFDLPYLDHDLGELLPNGEADPSKTGYAIMCFLEGNPKLKPGSVKIVSSNPVGRKNMQVVISRLYEK